MNGREDYYQAGADRMDDAADARIDHAFEDNGGCAGSFCDGRCGADLGRTCRLVLVHAGELPLREARGFNLVRPS